MDKNIYDLPELRCAICGAWLYAGLIFGLDRLGIVYCEKCGRLHIEKISLWFK